MNELGDFPASRDDHADEHRYEHGRGIVGLRPFGHDQRPVTVRANPY
jgi:hypothetical protein